MESGLNAQESIKMSESVCRIKKYKYTGESVHIGSIFLFFCCGIRTGKRFSGIIVLY